MDSQALDRAVPHMPVRISLVADAMGRSPIQGVIRRVQTICHSFGAEGRGFSREFVSGPSGSTGDGEFLDQMCDRQLLCLGSLAERGSPWA